jgi:hemolysin activation/secretion protein
MTFALRGCLWAALCLSWGAVFAQGAAAPSADAAAPTFDILEFQVEGNSVLPVEAIERAVTPFLGERKQMDAVEAARVALEKAYQSSGYLTVFVDVPEQRVDGGVVVLNVLEGRVERLKVTGSRYFSQGYIREKVPELADGKVPNFNEVQRQLALVNRTEDRRVQPIMRAGMTPGTVETELKVDDKLPLSGTVEMNNRAAADTKPLRLSVAARYENLFQLDHSVALTLATSPQDTSQSRVVSLNYTIPTSDQAAWVGYIVNSDSAVAALGDVNVLGKGTTVGLRYVRPLLGAADESHSVSLGFDYKDLKEETRSGDNVISTPLRYLPLQFAYNGTLDHGAQRQTQISLQTAVAFRRILQRDVDCPGGTVDQFACKRQGGDGGFVTLRGDLRHALPLASVGSVNLRLGAQMATGPVPSGEQYTIGGAESVRGYHEAEGAGDRALLGTIEWRSADFGARVSRWFGADGQAAPQALITQSYALAFVDVARAYLFEPATGQAPYTSLAGAGFGLRARVRKSITGEFDLAWPLKDTPATTSRSPRAHVKLAADF